VSNLNAALKDHPEQQAKPLHELIAHLADVSEDIPTVVRNKAGGHANPPQMTEPPPRVSGRLVDRSDWPRIGRRYVAAKAGALPI
jgi:superoxide dismutase